MFLRALAQRSGSASLWSGTRDCTHIRPTWRMVVELSVDVASDCARLYTVVAVSKGGVDTLERRIASHNSRQQSDREMRSADTT